MRATPPHTPLSPKPAKANQDVFSERIGSAGLAFLIGLVIAWFIQVL